MGARGAVRLSLWLPGSTTTVLITTDDCSAPGLLGWAVLTGMDAAARKRPPTLLHTANAIVESFRHVTALVGFEGLVGMKAAVSATAPRPMRWEAHGFEHVYSVELTGRPGTRELTRSVVVNHWRPNIFQDRVWSIAAATPTELHDCVVEDVRRINNRLAHAHSLRYEHSKSAPHVAVVPAPPMLPTFGSGMMPGDVAPVECGAMAAR